MKKILLIVLILVSSFVYLGCKRDVTVTKSLEYFLRPLELSVVEEELVGSNAIFEELLLYEYSIPKVYNVVELYIETYIDGVIENTETVFEESIENYSGKLMIKSFNENGVSLDYEFDSDIGQTTTNYKASLIFDKDEIKVWKNNFITYDVDLSDQNEMIIGSYIFMRPNSTGTISMRSFSNKQFEIEPKWVEHYDYVFLLKLKLKGKFE